MSQSCRDKDITRLIEAILVSPRAGQAVARALNAQCEARDSRLLIAEMRARRAEQQRDRDLDEADTRRMHVAAGDGASPWARLR